MDMHEQIGGLANTSVRQLSPYQPGKPIEELQRELGLHEIVKLASNENPLGPSPLGLEAAQHALREAHRYPDGNGFGLKRRLAAHLDVPAESITLGNGSNDVLELVARAFLAPGLEAVYSQYAFAVYPLAVQAAAAQGWVAAARPDYGHDLEAMLALITPNTRLVFIANPNNPTGTFVSGPELRAFLSVVPEQVIVVVDEAYFEYAQSDAYPDCLRWLESFPRLIVTRTFSKAYGLAGLRVGYAVSHPAIADLLNRVRQPFNVGVPALAAAQAALDDREFLDRSRALNRAGMVQLTEGIQALGLDTVPSIGNFLLVGLRRPAAAVYEALLRQGVIVRPVANYGLAEHLRVTVGSAGENQRFLAALRTVLTDV